MFIAVYTWTLSFTFGQARIKVRSPVGWFWPSRNFGNIALHAHFGQNLAMSTGRHSFKHNDAARLIRAVEAAGKTIKSVTLNNGAVTVALEAGQPPIDNNNTNPWDEVLKDDADKTEIRSPVRR